MKLLLLALPLLLLVACSGTSTSAGAARTGDGSPAAGDTWFSSVRQDHPDWYTCTQDNECVLVPTECGTLCKGDVVNSKAYSDFVVAQSKACAGASHTVRNCETVQRACVDGQCALQR